MRITRSDRAGDLLGERLGAGVAADPRRGRDDGLDRVGRLEREVERQPRALDAADERASRDLERVEQARRSRRSENGPDEASERPNPRRS
jgi:hypothetical protein